MSQREKEITQARVSNLLGLCNAVKTIKYDNEQSLRDFYFYCLKERNEGNYYSLDWFRKYFPTFFHKMQAILNKRTLIRRDIEIMKAVSKRVVFGALTFSDKNLKENEKNMLKKAQRYLEKYLSAYEIIEEYGQEHDRYHIHYIGIMRDNLTYIEFHNGWEDYSYIEAVKSSAKDKKKVSKYLCDYVIKQVPHIRRNKLLTDLIKKYHDYEIEKDVMEQNVKWLEIMKMLAVEEELPF